ncbi:MAG: hypothetical protein JO257_03620 [Deltaproteobacteria bacterium]|nr:hypothetical protein [Deltaproteobacteria bacterium]
MKWPLLLALAACGDPPPMTLKFTITQGDVQSCVSSTGTKAATCSDVTMLCDSYVSIRIFAPGDPTAPFVSACKPLAEGTTHKTLCSIAQVDLPAPANPVKAQTLEVDMAVYAKDKLAVNAMGEIECPAAKFGADDFPVAATEPCTDPDPAICPPDPAVGGRAFYHPGDTETLVTLGCTNLAALEDRMCAGQSSLAVTASVNDFDTAVSVSPATADGLLVSVGEPTFNGNLGEFELKPTQAHPLDRATVGPVPSWQGDFNVMLTSSACLEVLEDGAATTPSLTCTNNIAPNPLDLPGIRLSQASLAQILTAIGKTSLPQQGLVVGIALDANGAPAAGVTIVPSSGTTTIKYLNATRTGLVSGATSAGGVWVSEDAPYPTVFTPSGVQVIAQPGFGGLVHGKVDIVVIQQKPNGTGG